MNDVTLEALSARMTRVAESHLPKEGQPMPRGRVRAGSFDRWHLALGPVHEEDNWMMTYLDVITLLLMMLVVMLAFANPLSSASQAKGARAAARAAGTEQVPLASIQPPLPLPEPVPAKPATQSPGPESGAVAPEPVIEDLGDGIQVIKGQRSVSFRINSEVMFPSGDATLTPVGQAMVDRLLPVFNKVPEHTIVVVGHTDNQPMRSSRFPSNWELAAGRAAAVVRHLETRGLNPTRLMATGMADTHPLASNATPEGRAANRRVEITMEAPLQSKP